MLLLFPSTEKLSVSSLIPAGESALLRYSPVAANPNPLFYTLVVGLGKCRNQKQTHTQPPAVHSCQKEILWYLLSISDRMSRASSCTDTSSCLPMAPVSWAVIFLHTFAVMVEPARERFFPHCKLKRSLFTAKNHSIPPALKKGITTGKPNQNSSQLAVV